MKKIIALVLSFYLFILGLTPAFAVYDPNPKHSKWFQDSIVNDPTVKSTVQVKAQRTYPVVVYDPETASKNTINKPQKTSIKVLANVNKVGKKLLKGGAHAAIGAAVYDILLKSVDWVLDPENNSVKYLEPAEKGDYVIGCPEGSVCNKSTYIIKKKVSPTAALDVCKYLASTSNRSGPVTIKGVSCIVAGVYSVGSIATVDFSEPEQWVHIPINTVAQKVIEHANEGQAPAMQVMTDTALDALEAGELDNELEAGAEPKQYGPNEYAPGTEPNPEPNPDPDPDPEPNPDPDPDPDPNPNPNPNPEPTPTEWPAFCDWATTVCDWIEWSKEEPDPPEDTTVFVEDPVDFDTDKSYITFTGSCPPPYTASLNVMGNTVPFSFDYAPICSVMSSLAPFIKGAGYLTAAYIIAGFSRGTNG